MAESPITARNHDFAGWYQDVVLRGDMAEPAEIVKGMNAPAGRERLNQLAFDPVLSTPDQYAAHIKSEVAKWAQVAKTAGAKLD